MAQDISMGQVPDDGGRKVAMVTGASSGLGRAIAQKLAASGWTVALVARRRERLEAVAREIGHATVIAGDLRDDAFAAHAVRETVQRAGRLDLLVNNAGAPTPADGEGWGAVAAREFDACLALNVRAPYRLAELSLPHLRSVGGSIVNIGSTGVARNIPVDLAYLASKGALEVMSRGMAKRWAPLGVRVNTVSPGLMPTEIMQAAGLSRAAADGQLRSAVAAMQPLPRHGRVEDVAEAVAYLASDAAVFVTGATLHVDGGVSLGG